jgi:TolB protein
MRRLIILLSAVGSAMLLANGILLVALVEPAKAAFPGQNGNIAYAASDGNDYEIYTLSDTGGTPTQITNNTTHDYYPAYSPDGKTIAYRGSDGQIYSVPSSGGTPTKITNDSTTDKSYPEYSPDGSKITYSAYNSGN